jgi:hypothetical protein
MNYLGAGVLDSDWNFFWDVAKAAAPVYCAFTPWDAVVGAGPARDVTLDEARSLGLERHSLPTDPLFVDAASGDFRLLENSPLPGFGVRLFGPEPCGPRPVSMRQTAADPSFRSAGAVTFSD